MTWYHSIIFVGIFALSGCKTSVLPPSQNVGAFKSIPLQQNQVAAVKDGVNQVLASPFKFYSPKALKLNGESGIHVCGHVRLKSGSPSELAYYMELEEGSNPPKLKRGQVGTDPSKLSIVKFMCRRHGNI